VNSQSAPDPSRSKSFAQDHDLSLLDKAGRYLSVRKIEKLIGPVDGKRVADIGCGFDAGLATRLFLTATSVTLVDLAIDPKFATSAGWSLLEGRLPEILGSIESDSLDVVMCNNVVEHVWEDGKVIEDFHRILRPGGRCIVNVPSWLGKFALEHAAFTFGVAPPEEMNDHKRYYDPRDLWLLLVKSGFRPQQIHCQRHKLFTNTVARCIK
jgi:SAM-dependent methyltransferase